MCLQPLGQPSRRSNGVTFSTRHRSDQESFAKVLDAVSHEHQAIRRTRQLTFHLDTQKLGLWPGGFLTLELEGNWSDSVNASTGALAPVNTNQLFPLSTGNNVALPEWNFAQFLSTYGGVTFGKFDTSRGDMNEFAHGKGDIQFFNTAFSFNPIALITPYSTLGAGAIVLPTASR